MAKLFHYINFYGHQVQLNIIASGKNRYSDYFFGKKTLIICSSINEANALCKDLNDEFEASWREHPYMKAKMLARYASTYHSGNRKDDNLQWLDQYKQNESQVLIGVVSVIEGLDISDIELLINVSPSRLMYKEVQKLGRLIRKSPGIPYKNLINLCYGLPREQKVDSFIKGTELGMTGVPVEPSPYYMFKAIKERNYTKSLDTRYCLCIGKTRPWT